MSLTQTVLEIESQEDWENNTSLDSEKPEVIEDGSLRLGQIVHVVEGEDFDDVSVIEEDAEYSGGEISVKDGFERTYSTEFDLDYSFSEWGYSFREELFFDGDTDTENRLEVFRENNSISRIDDYTVLRDDIGWINIIDNNIQIDKGSVQFEIESGVGDGGLNNNILGVDVFAFYDNSQIEDTSFDNQVHEDDGFLDEPELYPDSREITLNEISTTFDVLEVEVDSVWTDVSENQAIFITSGDETKSLENTDGGVVEFENPTQNIEITLRLSNYGSRDSATPRFGFLTQKCSEIVVEATEFVELDASVSSTDNEQGGLFSGERLYESKVRSLDQEESQLRGVGPNFILGRIDQGVDREQSKPELLRVFVPGSVQPAQDRESSTANRVLSTEDFVLRFDSLGESADITVLQGSVVEEYGKQYRAKAFVFRNEWENVVEDVDKINEEILLIRDGSEEFRGRLVSYVNKGDEVKLEIGSFEEDALDAPPTGATVPLAGVSDEDVVENAINRVSTLDVDFVDVLDDDMSFLFSNSSPAKMIREVQRTTGAFVEYTNDKTVNYLESLGEDKTNLPPIGPNEQNVSEDFTVKEDEREEFTHVRVLGASQGESQIKAEAVVSTFEEGDDRQVWRKYTDSEITSNERAQSVADSIIDEYENEPRTLTVETTIFNREVNLGDQFRVVSDRDRVDRDLRVVKVEKVFQGSNIVYITELANRLLTRITDGEKQRRDVEKFNEGFQGDVVTLNSGGYRSPVNSSNSYVLSVRKPEDVVGELSAEIEIEGLPYRTYHSGSGDGGGVVSTTEDGGENDDTTFGGGFVSSTTEDGGGVQKIQTSGENSEFGQEAQSSETGGDVINDSGWNSVGSITESEAQAVLFSVVARNQSSTQPRARISAGGEAFPSDDGVVIAGAGGSGDGLEDFIGGGTAISAPVDELSYTLQVNVGDGEAIIYWAAQAWGPHNHDVNIEVEEHSHDFEVDEHVHSFDWLHSHEVSLPDHRHDPEPGIIEFPEELPSNVGVSVNGETVSTNVGNGQFTEVVDIGGLLEEGFNRIEITSDSLGHIRGTVAADFYRQITAE